MNQPQETIKGLVLFLKTDKGVFEVVLSDLIKREVYKLIDGYGITLIEKDVSEIIKI